MTRAKQMIRSLVNAVGYDVHRLPLGSEAAAMLLKSLRRFDIDAIFDIGANRGQFASELRALGYNGTIISFEPTSDAHTALAQAARADADWHVHSRCAVGDSDGETIINIAGNSFSSSVLPMLAAHASAAEGSGFVGSESVPMVRLDSIAPEYLMKCKRPFLKVDTQGFEWQVLDGARGVLAHFQGVLCEVSLVPLYDGQYLWVEVLDRLTAEGFTLWSIQPVFSDLRDGRTLQLDAAFFRL